MGLNIKNIKLNKDRYIYGIDKNINLSFELESDKNKTIKEIVISYGYNFYGEKQKHNAFNKRIIKKNVITSKEIPLKMSFIIPIKFFNLFVNDGLDNMKIENYVNIEVKNGLLNKNIKERLLPNIVIDQNAYGLKNIVISNNIGSGNEDKNEIEKLIVKSNNDEYLKIINEIKKDKEKLLQITDINLYKSIKGKEEEYNILSENINNLNKNKKRLFIIKDNKRDKFDELIVKKNKVKKDLENIHGDDFTEITNLLNEINLIEKDIYKCYSSENETEYYEIIDKYYNNILINNDSNKGDYNMSHLSKRIEIGKKIKKNQGDFIIIKKHFKGIFLGGIDRIIEENSLSADYVHKDVYEKLKENIIINLFDKLINSKIYNFIYKYIFILLVVFIINWIFGDFIFKIGPNYLSNYFLPVFLLLPISFILFSKLLEQFFESKLNNTIYDFKLANTKDIENSLHNKLLNGSLKISDFIERFNIKIGNNYMNYNFYISLDLNVGTYNQEGKHTNHHNHNVYSLKLFDYTGKGYFDLSKINLLNNNYDKLKLILPKSNKKPGTKVYYTLNYKFDSSHLPDISGKINLNI